MSRGIKQGTIKQQATKIDILDHTLLLLFKKKNLLAEAEQGDV